MEWLGEVVRRIRMLIRVKQFRADLEEEMRLHVDLRREQQAELGMQEGQARSAALRKFGNLRQLEEKSQMAWGWGWLENLGQDALYGLRGMLRSPGITAVALFSLSLGIGANTAIFSLMDAVMLRSLPVQDPDRLALLGLGKEDGITDAFGETDLYSYPIYRRFKQQNQVFSDVAAIFSLPNRAHGFVADRSEQESIQVQLVSGSYFDTLGVSALLGRTLTDDDDDTEGNHPVAVVSYWWWTRSLARDPAVLGKTLRIGSTVFTIVGVAPPEFFGTKVGETPDAWIPMSMVQSVPPHWGSYSDNFSEALYIVGRLKPGVTLEQATANVNLIYQQSFKQLLGSFPDNPDVQKNALRLLQTHVPMKPIAKGLSDVRSEFSRPLQILMAVVVLVLLIACANIANLLLVRSTARARELAVRQALGAGRFRLIRQLLTESLMLASVGGTFGIALASAGSNLLLRMVSERAETLRLDVSIHWTILFFTVAVTLLTAVFFGMVPAFRATRLDLARSLKEGRGATGSSVRGRLSSILVIVQISFSLVLLMSAGLFLRSLVNLNNIDTGFNKANVLLFNVDEPSAGYKEDDPRLVLLHQQIEERVHALPGVKAASYSSHTFHEGGWSSQIYVQGHDRGSEVVVRHNSVGTEYFATMEIPLIAGREFGPQDTASSPRVAIISETMARKLFPVGSPIGQHYGTKGKEHAGDIEVIGVVKDAKFYKLNEPAQILDYFPYVQSPGYLGDIEVRYSGDTGSIASAVRKTIHGIDRNLPIKGVMTLEERVASTTLDERLLAQLSTFFSLVAAFLSGIGIFGLMSYLVSRRTNEIGVRMALGAERSHVRGLVMREIVLLVGIGVAIGIPVTLLASRLVTSMLFGLRGTDTLTLVAATGFLVSVTFLSGYIPAQRASRINPVVALRYE